MTKNQKKILSLFVLLIFLFTLVLNFKLKYLINAVVPSSSMESTINGGSYIYGLKGIAPERGDIIIFQYPKDKTRTFIKRVIALPGETITITNGKVYISGKEYTEDYVKEPWADWNGSSDSFSCVVPDNEYFVMGDNRMGSDDSRYWGCVPGQCIKAKAFLLYYPFSEAKILK